MNELNSQGFQVVNGVFTASDIADFRQAITDCIDRVARVMLTPFETSRPSATLDERLEQVARADHAYATALFQVGDGRRAARSAAHSDCRTSTSRRGALPARLRPVSRLVTSFERVRPFRRSPIASVRGIRMCRGRNRADRVRDRARRVLDSACRTSTSTSGALEVLPGTWDAALPPRTRRRRASADSRCGAAVAPSHASCRCERETCCCSTDSSRIDRDPPPACKADGRWSCGSRPQARACHETRCTRLAAAASRVITVTAAIALGPRGAICTLVPDDPVEARILSEVRLPRVSLGFIVGRRAGDGRDGVPGAVPQRAGDAVHARRVGRRVARCGDLPCTSASAPAFGGIPGSSFAALAGALASIALVYAVARAAPGFSTRRRCCSRCRGQLPVHERHPGDSVRRRRHHVIPDRPMAAWRSRGRRLRSGRCTCCRLRSLGIGIVLAISRDLDLLDHRRGLGGDARRERDHGQAAHIRRGVVDGGRSRRDLRTDWLRRARGAAHRTDDRRSASPHARCRFRCWRAARFWSPATRVGAHGRRASRDSRRHHHRAHRRSVFSRDAGAGARAPAIGGLSMSIATQTGDTRHHDVSSAAGGCRRATRVSRRTAPSTSSMAQIGSGAGALRPRRGGGDRQDGSAGSVRRGRGACRATRAAQGHRRGASERHHGHVHRIEQQNGILIDWAIAGRSRGRRGVRCRANRVPPS